MSDTAPPKKPMTPIKKSSTDAMARAFKSTADRNAILDEANLTPEEKKRRKKARELAEKYKADTEEDTEY